MRYLRKIKQILINFLFGPDSKEYRYRDANNNIANSKIAQIYEIECKFIFGHNKIF